MCFNSKHGPYSFLAAAVFCCLMLGAENASGAHASKNQPTGTFTLYFENDTFFDTDALYTNGIKLTWVSADIAGNQRIPRLPQWIDTLIESLPFGNRSGMQRSVSLSVGQNMYTPEATEREDLIRDDRPYAGLLYGSLGLNCKNDSQMDTFEIIAGVVGPASLAEETQRLVHDLRGLDVPAGWDHQLEDEPIANIFFERKWRLHGAIDGVHWGWDLIPNVGGGLGNAFVGAHTGALLRFGWNLPNDFGTTLARPGSDTNAPIDQNDPRFAADHKEFGLHLFGAYSGTYVAHNITLDGNSFRDSHSVEKLPLVGNVMAGVGVIVGRCKVTFAHVLQTKEFEGQSGAHEYGSITVSVSF